ncbi:phospho-sugar mutase [Alkaliphilus sp. MSJ-5]|uniref:phosphoglucomutase (alpha-D-glucose-1,6-bisphosphate-dependent) n=1 Tax=Alkaliphilus flagellatus TaxID=2841507 RepID=A0ABS6G3F4_9FIRM|nr:phospho-sugar mutase [Alkaliphilus flagellatus]MBU5676676.1 phospho-sugar mutase [Alkaliphilus flagellatus]
MNRNIFNNYKLWLESPFIDEVTKIELESIKEDKKEIEDRFFKELEFGTAGLRGVIGAGTNRINKYTVRKVTQGLADYIKTTGESGKSRGVVIAYDSRRMSMEFAEETALVLAGNGIKSYLFKDLRPTPQLSFAIRYLNCISGIVITASHNPKEYNGYKVYWEDGAQIAAKEAEGIIDSIACVKDFGSIKMLEKGEAKGKGLLVYLDEIIDTAYIEEVKKQSLRRDIVKNISDDFKVVFTPLHGTGNIPVRRVLNEIGFKNVLVVPEQELPDSEFSTVDYPNPEDSKAFRLAIDLAKKEDASLIIGTDPDCDRIGAVVKDKNGEYAILTGNQIGVLLVNYILEALKEDDKLPSKGVIVKTIVTSEMGANIAKEYGIETINTLTGFKYIGEKINQFERAGEKVFLFGYEESYGYLAGTHARDKDAVVASMLICEMAAYYYSNGKNLYDVLVDLYNKYGYYLEDLKSITLEGKDGLEKINNIMRFFRYNSLNNIGDKRILYIDDYELQRRTYLDDYNNSEQITLPKANVIKFILDNESWICVRPSGTEPKLKIYCGVKENSLEKGKELLAKSIAWVEEMIQRM